MLPLVLAFGLSQAAPPAVREMDGPSLYRAHCASCHGAEGRGDGPAAKALKSAPTDLTRLAAKNGGKFPAERIEQSIAGQGAAAHGSREMPVWGPAFAALDNDRDYSRVRLRNLSEYLRKLQRHDNGRTR